MNLLCLYPTRQRRDLFLKTFKGYQERVKLSSTRFHIVMDEDDSTMNTPMVKELAEKYSNTTLSYGKSKGKIHAINRDLPLLKDYDVILLISDDMICQREGFDEVIVEEMGKRFPDTYGALWFPDGNEPDTDNLNTLICIGRTLVQEYGYLYNPLYKSFWCDNEYTDVLTMRGLLPKVPINIIEHHHPIFPKGKEHGAKPDSLYKRNEGGGKYFAQDEKLYWERKKENFGLDIAPVKTVINTSTGYRVLTGERRLPDPIALSILIPTVPGREISFNELKAFLEKQSLGRPVEILSRNESKEMTIGEKRNLLYEMANGKYSVQIDDDDTVPHDYVDRILKAIEEDKDCIGYKELCVFNGKRVKSSSFSLKYKSWGNNVDGFDHVRTPFYKMPIKTEIAKKVKFKHIRFGEDHEWAKAIYPHIKSETFIDEFMYIFRHKEENHDVKYGFDQEKRPTIIASNQPTKRCIISVGKGHWYPKGIDRLKQSLRNVEWSGDTFFWKNHLPHGSVNHEQDPYNYKVRAFDFVLKEKYTHVLWLDASIWAVKSLDPLFDYIDKNGHFSFLTGFSLAQSCNDRTLEYAGITRDEAEKIPEAASGCIGMNFRNERSRKWFELWSQYQKAGMFKGSRLHDNQSSDPRFQFHRQDQSCHTIAMWKLGMNICEAGEFIAYTKHDEFYGTQVDNDKLALQICGM